MTVGKNGHRVAHEAGESFPVLVDVFREPFVVHVHPADAAPPVLTICQGVEHIKQFFLRIMHNCLTNLEFVKQLDKLRNLNCVLCTTA